MTLYRQGLVQGVPFDTVRQRLIQGVRFDTVQTVRVAVSVWTYVPFALLCHIIFERPPLSSPCIFSAQRNSITKEIRSALQCSVVSRPVDRND